MTSPNTAAGAHFYSSSLLRVYDILILKISNDYAWRCPTKTALLPFFTANISQNHLDVGVGTGYYLRQAIASRALTKDSTVTLADLNPNSLEAAQGLLRDRAGIEATKLLWDIMKPLPLLTPDSPPMKFDSISLFYLLHCMPGPPSAKVSIFGHLKNNLSLNGVLYGATILGKGDGIRHNMFGDFLMRIYQRIGVFGNADDREQDFVDALRENFEYVETSVVGVVLLFRAERVKNL
jgi:hypothetical protein